MPGYKGMQIMTEREFLQIEADIFGLLSKYSGLKVDSDMISSNIVGDLGLDSFSVVELLYELEIKHGLTVPNEDLRKIVTISDLLNVAKRLLAIKT